jgi:hypothetical protein
MFFGKIQAHQWEDIKRRSTFQHIGVIVVLAIIAAISYWFFYAPILYSDDWSIVLGRWYSDKMHWFDLSEQRPLLKARLMILYGIFGLNIHAFYVVLWVLEVLNATLLYFLVLKFFPKSKVIAFSIAALVLVYPADFTHMWLIMINIRTVVLLVLLYTYLLLVYADGGHWVALWAALLCLLLSFGMYEGHLGMTMAWCVLVILIRKPDSWKRKLNLLLPLILGGLFILWRMVGYSFFEIEYADHNYEARLQLAPVLILSRLLSGYRLMVWAWLDPLVHAFGLKGWQAAAILLLLIILCIGLVYVISRIYRKLAGNYLTHQQHSAQLHRFMLLMLVGPILIAAGYIPYIMFFEPSYFPFILSSRGNLFALPGAAATLVALLTVIALLLSRKHIQLNLMVLAGVLPLILLGILIQMQVQYDNRVAWEEQKQIWHELFELAPDLKDGTSVHFILSDNERAPSLNKNGVRPALGPKSQVRAALNMLYGKHNLDGDAFIREILFVNQEFIRKKVFLEEGVSSYTGMQPIPYDRTIFLAYDGHPRQLRVIEDLQAENLVSFPVPNYAPYDRIVETPATGVGLRWLVGVTPNTGD